MGLKTYSLRLDENVYEELRKGLTEFGDPDLNISFLIRKFLKDLYEALPNLKKSDTSLQNNMAFWSLVMKTVNTTAQFGNILKGEPITVRAQLEQDEKSPKTKTGKKLKNA